MIEKIISGAQTGVDRAALDAARKLRIPHGGWCPKGRKAEDGTISECYTLKETVSADYNERTKLNIRDSDATFILVKEVPIKVTDGTILTIREVKDKEKPFLIFDLSGSHNIDYIKKWIIKNKVKTLNIAGPRESQSPGIYTMSLIFLEKILPDLAITASNRLIHSEETQERPLLSRL